jgi:hypothetical protein
MVVGATVDDVLQIPQVWLSVEEAVNKLSDMFLSAPARDCLTAALHLPM